MGVHLGAGWHLHHITDREVVLRKDDVAYRQVLDGRDAEVRICAEPGMDRNTLIEKAVKMAKRNDDALAERIGKQLVPRHLGRYQQRQQELTTAFGTPEALDIIGRKRP